MEKYGLMSNIKAKQGKGRELADILVKASELMERAKGCHKYLVAIDQSNSDCVWITKVWDSKEDYDNSLKMTRCC
ncbi:MAG TPA: antibiotic biosynthesis monooxygenase [Saprospiraceae bacterium]|nr:antibiotic biosynthesis monooxygenase [Saprospiraceae bacterium]HMP24555.1 antibiotic biosynthesis monooxygenase [Saprospiraceae bacterium]